MKAEEEMDMRSIRTNRGWFPLLLAMVSCLMPLHSAFSFDAQDPQQDSSSKPAAPPAQPPSKPSSKAGKDTATQNAPDQPAYDPARAEKDLEVGRYYMRKGDVDAAIDRFQDAIEAKPGYAIPFRYLAEAQEKKGLKKQAIKSYTRYLDLDPHAEDGDKVRKKIEKLRKDVEKEDR